jgi:hypothetical protein
VAVAEVPTWVEPLEMELMAVETDQLDRLMLQDPD